MVPQGKEWRVKTASQTEAVKPPEGAVQPPEAVRPADQAVKQGSPEMPLGFASLVPKACDDKVLSVPTPEGEEELVD
jgi:hypothetical protein